MPFLAEWEREGCNVNGLEVKNLRVCARLSGGSESAIVRGLDFYIAPGQRLAIVGTSGCGKTMTALAILGLLPENCRAEGSVRWEGEELLTLPRRKRRALLGRSHVLIPQSGADFLNPALSVRSQMNDALVHNGVARAQRKTAAETLLRREARRKSGVCPSSSRSFTSAPWSSSEAIASQSANSAAICSDVRP